MRIQSPHTDGHGEQEHAAVTKPACTEAVQQQTKEDQVRESGVRTVLVPATEAAGPPTKAESTPINPVCSDRTKQASPHTPTKTLKGASPACAFLTGTSHPPHPTQHNDKSPSIRTM